MSMSKIIPVCSAVNIVDDDHLLPLIPNNSQSPIYKALVNGLEILQLRQENNGLKNDIKIDVNKLDKIDNQSWRSTPILSNINSNSMDITTNNDINLDDQKESNINTPIYPLSSPSLNSVASSIPDFNINNNSINNNNNNNNRDKGKEYIGYIKYIKYTKSNDNYGFISVNNNEKDIFFHFDAVILKYKNIIKTGDYVSFNILKQKNGKKKAINVKKHTNNDHICCLLCQINNNDNNLEKIFNDKFIAKYHTNNNRISSKKFKTMIQNDKNSFSFQFL